MRFHAQAYLYVLNTLQTAAEHDEIPEHRLFYQILSMN